MFFNTKEQWYGIVTSSPDVDTGYRRLDSFFKSVCALMSNQLWTMVDSSLTSLEEYFSQFAGCASEVSVFSVKLVIAGPQIRFDPPLGDLESVIQSILQELVGAIREFPRVETKLFTSLKSEALYLPSMKISDDRIDDGRYIRSIVTKNTMAPQKYLMTYDKYKNLLTHKAEKRIEDFLREKHELEDYEIVCLLVHAYV
jgi:dynein heavy chain